jgi:hypothetical protein
VLPLESSSTAAAAAAVIVVSATSQSIFQLAILVSCFVIIVHIAIMWDLRKRLCALGALGTRKFLFFPIRSLSSHLSSLHNLLLSKQIN